MKTFAEYLKERFILEDPDDIIDAVHDYLADMADELEKEEPYATKSIQRLRDAAYEVFCINDET